MPHGTVQKLDGEYAIVQIKRNDMCGDCHACDTVHPAKDCTLKCINTAKSKVGDFVELSLEEASFLKATYIIYGLPLIGFLGGIILGFYIANFLGITDKELLMIGGSVVGLIISFLFVKNRDKKNKYKKMLPQVISIISSN